MSEIHAKPSGPIVSTHTGSLPRPADMAELLSVVASNETPDPELFATTAAAAIEDAVARQAAAGIDYVSDGEMRATSFLETHGRLTGFDGQMGPYFPTDLAGGPVPTFAEYYMQHGTAIMASNTSKKIEFLPDGTKERISQFQAALDRHPEVAGGFLTTPSPGILTRLGTSAFDTHEDFLNAIADALAEEYNLIADAGLMIQIDSPDLAMGHHTDYVDLSVDEFRDLVRTHIRALNRALEGIPAQQVRLHACWGNYPGPHHHDLPLEDIIDLLYEANVGNLVIEQANPRHRHEWEVFQRHPLPDDMVLAAGVVDSITPHLEHPQVVAESLIRLAEIVGAERLQAATDCGFSTFAGVLAAPANFAYLKLGALAEGTQLANDRLRAEATTG